MLTPKQIELIELLPFAFIQVDTEGKYVYVNAKYTALTGFTIKEFGNIPFWERQSDPDIRQQNCRGFMSIVKHQRPAEPTEILVDHSDGRQFTCRSLWSYLRDEQGNLTDIMFFIEDITDIKATENELALSMRQYIDLFSNSHDALLIIEEGRFVDCNDAALEMLGYEHANDFKASHPAELSPPFQPDGSDSRQKIEEMMQQAFQQGSHRFEWEHVRANGEKFPVEVTFTPLTNVRGVRTLHTTWRDLTEFKHQQNTILQQAHFDSLTGLPNRFLLLDRLSQTVMMAKRAKQNIAVLFIDLDNFKLINDSLGHSVGDKILIEAGERLRNVIRGSDTVGRLGGDEFLVILQDLPKPSDAALVATKIIKSFNRSFNVMQREFMMTTSIGIACFPDDGHEDKILLQRADIAMYHAKGEGKNRYQFFTSSMNNNAKRKLQIEGQLHGALARGEFHVLFQPMINLKTMQVEGAEALLRWNNNALGTISPDEFIPLAENMGFIEEIGLFVIEEACHEANLWRQTLDREIFISINVSPQQIKSGKLFNYLIDCIIQSPLPNHLVHLEITEGVLMVVTDEVMKCFSRLNSLGIKLGLDDFGTGYSSLNYLRKFPFSILKIDQSFVQDICDSETDSELLDATIAMAKAMHLKLVAEGIETKEQCKYLQHTECELGQGYLFSRPITSKDFLEFTATFTPSIKH